MLDKRILVAGLDPAFKNWGIARAWLDLDTLTLDISSMKLVQTDKRSGKDVRVNSDDLRRARELRAAMMEQTSDCAVIFAEIPSGSQSARSNMGFGIAIGVIAGAPVEVIQVQPLEAKLAMGKRSASKKDMIDWATAKYPHSDWLSRKLKGQMVYTDANEHLADAIAIIEAGVKTEQFRQLLNLWRSTRTIVA